MHTLTRENTGQNVGYRVPIVHWDFVQDWDGLDVKCVPKGSGSENMSFLKMCVPADGVAGIKRFVLDSIVGAGGKPCPPGIVGVGIGGSADYAMHLAKEAIARPVGTRNPDPQVAKLEDELYELLNETGIGPMGLGGDVTVLQCHVEHADTHMTLNPVAVNYQCWAARRATAHVAPTAPSTTTGRPDAVLGDIQVPGTEPCPRRTSALASIPVRPGLPLCHARRHRDVSPGALMPSATSLPASEERSASSAPATRCSSTATSSASATGRRSGSSTRGRSRPWT